jgi:hypothetical protein
MPEYVSLIVRSVFDCAMPFQAQRTPINHNRTTGFHQAWLPQPSSMRTQQHRPTFRTGSISENSENEVDNMLGKRRHALKSVNNAMYVGYTERDDTERGTLS